MKNKTNHTSPKQIIKTIRVRAAKYARNYGIDARYMHHRPALQAAYRALTGRARLSDLSPLALEYITMAVRGSGRAA
jgi:hypothetical protein